MPCRRLVPASRESSTTEGKVKGKRAAFRVDAAEGGKRMKQKKSPTPCQSGRGGVSNEKEDCRSAGLEQRASAARTGSLEPAEQIIELLVKRDHPGFSPNRGRHQDTIHQIDFFGRKQGKGVQ